MEGFGAGARPPKPPLGLRGGGVRELAEVDGNRTRRTRIARPDRFEDGEVHQAPGHLRHGGYSSFGSLISMKRLLMLIAVLGLGFAAVKKLQKS